MRNESLIPELETALKERVFQPGNLVWGDLYPRWASLIEHGIGTSTAFSKHPSWSWTPDEICMAILSRMSLPNRYTGATHHGPKPHKNSSSAGVILSREAILERFPEQVFAVGTMFDQRHDGHFKNQSKIYYDVDDEWKTAFGIPTKILHKDTYPDEVRLSPTDPKLTIPTDLWLGIVIDENQFPVVDTNQFSFERILPIPVFTPDLRLIDTHFRVGLKERTKYERTKKRELRNLKT